jgi:hypothetical protein
MGYSITMNGIAASTEELNDIAAGIWGSDAVGADGYIAPAPSVKSWNEMLSESAAGQITSWDDVKFNWLCIYFTAGLLLEDGFGRSGLLDSSAAMEEYSRVKDFLDPYLQLVDMLNSNNYKIQSI